MHFALKGKGDNPVTCTATECGFRYGEQGLESLLLAFGHILGTGPVIPAHARCMCIPLLCAPPRLASTLPLPRPLRTRRRANSTRVDCATTECKCQRDCPDVQGILGSINGKPCSIDCTPEGVCTFDIQDFFVTLVAPCATAACVVPGYSFVEGAPAPVQLLLARVLWEREQLCMAGWRPAAERLRLRPPTGVHATCPMPSRLVPAGDYTITQSQGYDPVIAAIPLMVLVGLAAFLSLYLARHRSLFRSARRAGSGSGGGSACQQRKRCNRAAAAPRPSAAAHV